MRIGLIILLSLTGALRAQYPAPFSKESTRPYDGVELNHFVFKEPRPLRCWAVRVDVTQPDIEWVVTPYEKVQEGWQTRSSTTLDFARKEGVQLAINASPFSPLRKEAAALMRIDGLHLSRGKLIAPPKTTDKQGALLLLGDNHARLSRYPLDAAQLKEARHGVGGFAMVLEAGKKVSPPEKDQPVLHPRTAVGLSEKGRYVWLLLVDGRQEKLSEGLSITELGDWALSLGITDLLNLDGGGSSTLVLQDNNTSEHKVINTPVGTGPPGSLRQNGNNLGLRFYRAPGDLTLAKLRAIMPNLSEAKAKLFLGPLNRAMKHAEINTPLRQAMFLAQLAHESGELRYMEEIASGEAYEGRKDLGNTEKGDGKRYKGRGPIQLTGRFNYRKAGEALGLDLETNPEQATDPEVGCQIAAWFWKTRDLNKLADANDYQAVTKKINGGYHGMAQREKYFAAAKKVLGLQ
jgi:predicted chitinase